MVWWGLLGLAVAWLIYVRVAPSAVDKWHRKRDVKADRDREGGAQRVLEQAGTKVLERLDEIALLEPGTVRLAGSPEDGHVSYISRSKLFGLPDYTNIWLDGDTVKLDGRLRFGRSDLGVNRKRLERWLRRLEL